MKKIRILVAIHKDTEVFADSVYTPIWAGKALSQANLKWEGDNTGDNISDKNKFYSETSVHYWAWKNIKDVEYIGFCHYRRFFSEQFDESNIDKFMYGYDIVLPCPMYNYMMNKLNSHLSMEDRAIFISVLKQFFPKYYPAAVKYLLGRKDYPYNMFICKKELFDSMMKFVFDVLFTCEKYVKLSPYTTSKRIYGYLAEYLIPIYCIAHNLRVKTMPLVDTLENNNKVIHEKMGIKQHVLNFLYKLRPIPVERMIIPPAVLLGLEIDGIMNHDGNLIV